MPKRPGLPVGKDKGTFKKSEKGETTVMRTRNEIGADGFFFLLTHAYSRVSNPSLLKRPRGRAKGHLLIRRQNIILGVPPKTNNNLEIELRAFQAGNTFLGPQNPTNVRQNTYDYFPPCCLFLAKYLTLSHGDGFSSSNFYQVLMRSVANDRHKPTLAFCKSRFSVRAVSVIVYNNLQTYRLAELEKISTYNDA